MVFISVDHASISWVLFYKVTFYLSQSSFHNHEFFFTKFWRSYQCLWQSIIWPMHSTKVSQSMCFVNLVADFLKIFTLGFSTFFQDIIKLWSWFSTCDYAFLDPTNHFNHFAFVSSGKHWFPDDSNHVINGDHNDDHSDNNDNYVDYNNQNDFNYMVIMIAMVATGMIMKTTMIKIIMVIIIIAIMMMVKH